MTQPAERPWVETRIYGDEAAVVVGWAGMLVRFDGRGVPTLNRRDRLVVEALLQAALEDLREQGA